MAKHETYSDGQQFAGFVILSRGHAVLQRLAPNGRPGSVRAEVWLDGQLIDQLQASTRVVLRTMLYAKYGAPPDESPYKTGLKRNGKAFNRQHLSH